MRIQVRLKYIAVILFFAAILVIFVRAMWSQRLERGYVAFNAKEYQAAKEHLLFIGQLGDRNAQQLLSYMSGLGLGQPVDFGKALYWMQKGNGSMVEKHTVAEQAYYLGIAATDGLYGENKKELGVIWLKIAHFSGEQKATIALKKYNAN